jgi:hydrogenase maturation factor
VDGTGFGDFWDVPVPIKYLWTARAQGLFSSLSSYLQAYALAQTGTQDVVSATFIGYVDDTASTAIFSAAGFVERASFLAPEAMAEQEIEIRGVGNPTLIR